MGRVHGEYGHGGLVPLEFLLVFSSFGVQEHQPGLGQIVFDELCAVCMLARV